jgi:threonine dehydratase
MPTVTRTDIDAAEARIRPHIRRTPVMDIAPHLQVKLEFLQHGGSFKPRGAFNTLLSHSIPKAGVAAASGGNHGLAVALAAKSLGVPATIFVPEIASPAKIAGIRACGADLRIGGARYNDALAACEAYIAATGALSVHAYDAVETIAGQGTVAREWDEQCGAPLDTVLVAVGGGGLIAGMAAWWDGRVKVVGVEPENSRALHAAMAAGKLVDVDVNSVAADSLGARRVGTHVLEIARKSVDRVVLVPDAAITSAQQALWRDLRIAAEPGGAAAYGAWLSGAYKPASGERVGVLLCGANVDLAKLAEIAAAVA